jgi:hypothetical protein
LIGEHFFDEDKNIANVIYPIGSNHHSRITKKQRLLLTIEKISQSQLLRVYGIRISENSFV